MDPLVLSNLLFLFRLIYFNSKVLLTFFKIGQFFNFQLISIKIHLNPVLIFKMLGVNNKRFFFKISLRYRGIRIRINTLFLLWFSKYQLCSSLF